MTAVNYLGSDYKLYVSDMGTPTATFSPLSGETTLKKTNQTDFVDTSSKTTGRVKTQRPARYAITIDVTCKAKLPDATGVEYVHGLATADPQAPNDFQIRKTPFSDTDIVFACSMYVGGGDQNFPDADNSEINFTLTAADTPSVDLIEPA